jgi:carbohydrate-binding DOMON domain-containing protein
LQVLTGGQTGGHKNTAYGVGKFMTVGEQSRQQQGGGGTDAEFNPNVYDILIPKGADQMEILGSYDATKKKRVIIPMISVRQW